jgi:hypothetical protein
MKSVKSASWSHRKGDGVIYIGAGWIGVEIGSVAVLLNLAPVGQRSNRKAAQLAAFAAERADAGILSRAPGIE